MRAVKILWPNFLFDENFLKMCYVKFVLHHGGCEFGVIDTFETQLAGGVFVENFIIKYIHRYCE